MRRKMPANGFSLVELLVVLGLIALISSLVLPAILAARSRASKLVCQHRLAQIGKEVHLHYEARRLFPDTSYLSIQWQILDYLGYEKRSIVPLPKDQVIPDFICLQVNGQLSVDSVDGEPIQRVAGTSYGGSIGLPDIQFGEGFAPRYTNAKQLTADRITDGLSKTVMMAELIPSVESVARSEWLYRVERSNRAFHLNWEECQSMPAPNANKNPYPGVGASWTQAEPASVSHIPLPFERACYIESNDVAYENHLAASSLHGDGFLAAFGDGAVRYLSANIDRRVWRAIGTVRNGEFVSFPW